MPSLVLMYETVRGIYDDSCPEYSGPCDWGDETLSFGLMIWAILIGGAIVLALIAYLFDLVFQFPRRRKRRNELWARGFFSNEENPPSVRDDGSYLQHLRGKSLVTYRCPQCDHRVSTYYKETVGKEPVDLCRRCSSPPD